MRVVPCRPDSTVCHRLNLKDPGLQEGMILSDEPGYYEDGNFGIRCRLASSLSLSLDVFDDDESVKSCWPGSRTW